MWLAKASTKVHQLNIDGRIVALSDEDLSRVIKSKLIKSKAIQNLFREFKVDSTRLNALRIEFTNLDDRYAETDGEKIVLNSNLIKDKEFFRKYFFVVAHEIVHWLSRIKEQDAYLNDPEETLGFCTSIAYELENGADRDEIWNRVYPKISFHFSDKKNAAEFFARMFQKAKQLLSA